MSEKNENKGVPDVECTSVGPSAASPQAITPSGLSASVPDAPAHRPFNAHSKGIASVHKDGITLRITHPAPVRHKSELCRASEVFMGRTEREANAAMLAECWNSYYPSREIIEKLTAALEILAAIPVERFIGGNSPGSKPENPIMGWGYYPDREPVQLNVHHVTDAREVLTEARAFLNKNNNG